ncbi:MAG: hypothetical protein V4510_13435 [bacterium]
MNVRVLALALVALSFSGCFGYPPGTAHPGDRIVIYYTATDEASGTPITDGCYARFTLGTQGIDANLESALQGKPVGGSVTVHGVDVSTLPCQTQLVRHDEIYVVVPGTKAMGRPAFENFYHATATVGYQFQTVEGLNATVSAADNRNVTYRIDNETLHPGLGLDLVIVNDGANATLYLHPDGSAKVFQGPVPALQVGAGEWFVAGLRDHEIVFASTASAMLDSDGRASITATVTAIAPDTGGSAGDNYGTRRGIGNETMMPDMVMA